MIIEVVTVPTPQGWERDRMLEDARHAVAKWSANKDLLRKHVAIARNANDDASHEAVKARSASYPHIRTFDLFLLVDNEHGKVTEWAADGKARTPEPA